MMPANLSRLRQYSDPLASFGAKNHDSKYREDRQPQNPDVSELHHDAAPVGPMILEGWRGDGPSLRNKGMAKWVWPTLSADCAAERDRHREISQQRHHVGGGLPVKDPVLTSTLALFRVLKTGLRK
jgi:hypothetical protein